MAEFAINETVSIKIDGETLVGKLVDIDVFKKRFKVQTDMGPLWVPYFAVNKKESGS